MENGAFEAAAAVQRGSGGNRWQLLDSGSARLHEARPRRGGSRHFKLAPGERGGRGAERRHGNGGGHRRLV